jgi:hypothetical protein
MNTGRFRSFLAKTAVLGCLGFFPTMWASDARGEPVNFLFIHHSCGGQLLAAEGEQQGGGQDSGERCIYKSHPNGGGLRAMLEAEGFVVNEASYGSIIGEDTDIHDWPAKFREQMDRILKSRKQDELLPDGATNRIVAFKSCYPNNGFVGLGQEPGNPEAPELTVANAKAAYRSLLKDLAAQPEVLFVAFTAPPLTEPQAAGIKAKLKAVFKDKPQSAQFAREFNQWLANKETGWLSEYSGTNLAVFDYYDILTNEGKTNWSAYAAKAGSDSHPTSEGNRKAAKSFIVFIRDLYTSFQNGR